MRSNGAWRCKTVSSRQSAGRISLHRTPQGPSQGRGAMQQIADWLEKLGMSEYAQPWRLGYPDAPPPTYEVVQALRAQEISRRHHRAGAQRPVLPPGQLRRATRRSADSNSDITIAPIREAQRGHKRMLRTCQYPENENVRKPNQSNKNHPPLFPVGPAMLASKTL